MALKDWKKISKTNTYIIYKKKNSKEVVFIGRTLSDNWRVLYGRSANTSSLQQLRMSFMGERVIGERKYITSAENLAKQYMRTH